MHDPAPYQVLPPMAPEQFEALKRDIAERGVLTPIDLDEQGRVLDGHHRLRACAELGITDYGYATDKKAVVENLVQGMSDPSDKVRNNAMRTLLVFADAAPGVSASIL